MAGFQKGLSSMKLVFKSIQRHLTIISTCETDPVSKFLSSSRVGDAGQCLETQ
jgi:hypothetical protein